jgi:hypothetical protein
MPSSLQKSQDLTKAIHKKLLNELLELQEFRSSSQKVITGFSNELKREIDDYINKFNLNFLQACRKLQTDLETATQVLYTSSLRCPIVDLFEGIERVEDIYKVHVLTKSFELPVLTIKSFLQDALNFEVKIADGPVNGDSGFFRAKSMSFVSQEENRKSLLRTSSFLGVSPAAKFKVLDFSRPISDTLYSVFPFSNKIFSFNIKDQSKAEISLENVKFPSKTACSLAKDGKLLVTGGFDESVRKTCFSISFHNSRCEELPKLNSARFNHSQLTIENQIFVFGGVSKSSVLECEKLSLDSKKWSKFANLNVGRECPASAYHLGKVFVCGGNGIESIESASTTAKKFDLLMIRLPFPGRVNVFFVDRQAMLLVRDKAISMEFHNNTYKNIGNLNENCQWTSSDYLINEGEVFWISEGRLVSLSLKDLTMKITE